MKIGVSSYSFSQYLSSGKMTVKDTITKAAEMGFDAIEFTGLDAPEGITKEDFARELKEYANEKNIEISAYVVGANLLCDTVEEERKAVEAVKSEIDIASILGVKLFRHDVLFKLPRHVSFNEAMIRTAPLVREIAEYGKKHKITTMIENHGYAFQDADRVEKLYNAVNHKNFSLLIDIGNFMCADEDTYISVSRLANLASHVHAKDFVKIAFDSDASKENTFRSRGCNYLRGTAVGYGDAKTLQCIEILKSAGYDGYVDIEFEGPEDCIEELQKGLSVLKKICTD